MNSETSIPIFRQNGGENASFLPWVLETHKLFIVPRVLVAGERAAYFSSLLTSENIPTHVSDFNKESNDKMKSLQNGNSLIRAVHDINFSSKNFKEEYASINGVFATLLFFSSPIHQITKGPVLDNLEKLLVEEGQLILVMPAFTAVYEGLKLPLSEWKTVDRRPVEAFLNKFLVARRRYFQLDNERLPGAIVEEANYVIVVAYKRAQG